MNEPLSNPLRRSLADGTPQGPHPEADLLTAFAEGSLTRRERESVLSHLATCAECREVLGVAANAAPQIEETTKPQLVARPVRPPLRSWLPWVSTAAAVVVVGSAVLMHELPRRRGIDSETSTSVVHKSQTPAPSEKKLDGVMGEIATSAAPASDTARVTNESKDNRKKPEEKPMAALATQRTDRDETRATAPPPPPVVAAVPSTLAVKKEKLSASQQVVVESQAAEVQAANVDKTADLKLQTQLRDLPLNGRTVGGMVPTQRPGLGSTNAVQQTPSQQNARQNRNESADQYANAKVSQAAPPTRSAEMQQNVAAVPAPAFGGPATMRKASRATSEVDSIARPHWRIDDNGRLQRSFGDGQWQSVLPVEPSRFRVVSVMGAEVWAGGDNSRLYHSIDNGSTWTAVRLPAKDKSQHAINSIHFQTTQAGTITTEDGTTWSTTDGGKSWQ